MSTATVNTFTTGLYPGPLPAEPTWLRANVKPAAQGIGVDREQKAILGYVVAQAGAFLEPDPRGEFDEKSLRQVVRLMRSKPNGTKMRFGHPSLSGDALGTTVARGKNPRLDVVNVERDGKAVELMAVRADAQFLDSAFETPSGDLAGYLLTLAEESPDMLGSSLVLQIEEEVRLDNHGKPKLDDNGNPLPPLWRPTAIHASDFVDQGAAVDGLLSAGISIDGLPDAVVRQAWQLLDRQFGDAKPEVIRARCLAWLDRYLAARRPLPTVEELFGNADDGAAELLDLDVWIRERESGGA